MRIGQEQICQTTHVAQNVDRPYRPMFDLSPGVPPPDSTANLYCPCQGHATHQEQKFKLAWGGFIAKTEVSVVRGGGWLQGLKAKPAPTVFYKGVACRSTKAYERTIVNVTLRQSATPLHSDGG